MMTPIFLLLAEEGFLPNSFDREAVDEALEKFLVFCFEQDRLDLLERVNKLFGLDLKDISRNLSEDCGPYCPKLRTNLETRCGLGKCKFYAPHFTFNCSAFGQDSSLKDCEEELKAVLDTIAKVTIAKAFENEFAPAFEFIPNKSCCNCGSREANKFYREFHLCTQCQATVLGGKLRLVLEIEFGRPILEILGFITRKWHSPQEQAKALGIKVSSLRELCTSFSVNPTKYRTKDEKRFTNPFANKRRGKDNSGAHLQRLWFRYVANHRIHPIQPHVNYLANYLLSQANSFLGPRGLEEFTLMEIRR